MKKKMLFLVSVFAVAMFSVALAQGPKEGKCPKAKTECCQKGENAKACEDCACNADCKEAKCADCKGCTGKADCKKECPKTAKADCKKGDKPCCTKK